jgi:hypothetical protein
MFMHEKMKIFECIAYLFLIGSVSSTGSGSGDDSDDPPKNSDNKGIAIKIDTGADPGNTRVAELLSHLFGEAIDSMSSSFLGKQTSVITIDCQTTAEDMDSNINIVTTLCPFLRENSPCGQMRRPSYELVETKKLCSKECATHVNALMNSLRNRGKIPKPEDQEVFRAIVDGILLQYAGACRIGSFYVPN